MAVLQLRSQAINAASACSALHPVAFLTILTCRTCSFSLVATTSTIRLPNTLPDLIISPVESMLSTSFCAVPAFIREEPVTTSAPTIGVMANSAVVETALPGLQEIPTVRQPSWRAYSSPAITYGVRPLAAMPTTTSCAVKLIFFRSLTPPSRLSSAPSTAC